MKFLGIVCLALCLSFTTSNIRAQNPKPLTELKAVYSPIGFESQDNPFSLMGRVMHFGLGATGDDASASVYDLGGKYTRFEAWVGVSDSYARTDRVFSVRLDGKLVLTNESDPLKSGDAPIHVSIDVTGVQSLRLRGLNGIFFGEPVLYRRMPASASVANLVAPQDGTTVSTGSVRLLWEPVSDATGYGVEIVCTKGNSPRIYALNASDSTARFDLTGVPNGQYQWSVISFNGRGVMGKFSAARMFVVAH